MNKIRLNPLPPPPPPPRTDIVFHPSPGFTASAFQKYRSGGMCYIGFSNVTGMGSSVDGNGRIVAGRVSPPPVGNIWANGNGNDEWFITNSGDVVWPKKPSETTVSQLSWKKAIYICNSEAVAS